MSRPTSSPITAADAVLWTALDPGVRSLPQPVPAGLCELPLARLSRYEPKPDPATGKLPDEEWVHVHRLRALTGQWYAVRIAGDAALGLPRAGDWPVLMAVVRLFEESGWQSNTLTDVSIRRVLTTMGVSGGGKMIRRVRDALVRFAQVRVLVVPIAPAADPAEALAELAAPAGDEQPDGTAAGVPALWTPGRVAGRARGRRADADVGAPAAASGAGLSTGVLDVVWRDDTIERITMADAWRPRGGVTPTAWVDYERYFALADPVAQRLYQLLAGAVARGEAVPLEQSLDWLRSALGLSARFKRSRVIEYLSDAVAELQAAEILGEVVFEPAGRGAERVVAMPGPVLQAAQLFAGLTLEVPRDTRVQLAVLQRLGVHRAEAERLLRTDPAQTYEVVCWVLWAQRHEPDAIRDPGPYIRKAVAEGYRFARPAYLRWRAGVQQRSLDLVRARAERPAATAALPAATPAAPVACAVSPVAARDEVACAAPVGFTLDGADADAGALWAAIAAELRRRVGPRDLRMLWVTTQLEQVAGARLADDALVCATPDLALRGWMAGDAGRALLDELAAAVTDGAVTRVVVRVPGDVDRPVDDSLASHDA